MNEAEYRATATALVERVVTVLEQHGRLVEKALERYPGATLRRRLYHIVVGVECGVAWPGKRGESVQYDALIWVSSRNAGSSQNVHHDSIVWRDNRSADIVTQICEICRWQPRRILRAVRQIEAATAWCTARVAGLQREHEHMLAQQAHAVRVLETLHGLQEISQ